MYVLCSLLLLIHLLLMYCACRNYQRAKSSWRPRQTLTAGTLGLQIRGLLCDNRYQYVRLFETDGVWAPDETHLQNLQNYFKADKSLWNQISKIKNVKNVFG